jgi:hypothetical protein
VARRTTSASTTFEQQIEVVESRVAGALATDRSSETEIDDRVAGDPGRQTRRHRHLD